jgi:pyridoxine/pyridoxamine 5'-phosphate oxidase
MAQAQRNVLFKKFDNPRVVLFEKLDSRNAGDVY